MPPLDEIGLTDLPKSGGGAAMAQACMWINALKFHITKLQIHIPRYSSSVENPNVEVANYLFEF